LRRAQNDARAGHRAAAKRAIGRGAKIIEQIGKAHDGAIDLHEGPQRGGVGSRAGGQRGAGSKKKRGGTHGIHLRLVRVCSISLEDVITLLFIS
jgi:hypothetical protein